MLINNNAQQFAEWLTFMADNIEIETVIGRQGVEAIASSRGEVWQNNEFWSIDAPRAC